MAASPVIVRFSTHRAARAARRAAAELTSIAGGVDTQYNERSYDGRTGEAERDDDDGRGWCTFESSASSEVLIRLSAYPKMKAALEELPPKMLALSSTAPIKVVELDESKLAKRVEEVTERIERATFTGKGDKPMVVNLYKDYVERIATSLQQTLGSLQTLGSSQRQLIDGSSKQNGLTNVLNNIPAIVVPDASPLRLAQGQLLLLLRSSAEDHAGASGGVKS